MTSPYAVTASLELATNGIPVFPCFPIGTGKGNDGRLLDKSPRVAAWAGVASTDPKQIQNWWAKWPDSLVGVPTGEHSRLFVLDLDIKNGKNGVTEIQRLSLDLPPTRINYTASGGQHALYLAPAGMHCPTNSDVIGPGIDLRGDGGYIIWWPAHGMPVSVAPLVTAPEWMTKPAVVGESMPPMGITDEEIEELLSKILPARMESRSEWIKVGMALHHEMEGDAAGLQLWTYYSSLWPKYEGPESVAKEWKSFGRGQRTHVTLRSFVPPGWRRTTPSPTEVFGDRPTGTVVERQPVAIEEQTLLFPEQQAAHFAGCVYVIDLHRIITLTGQCYDQPRFNAIYGGRTFVMDKENTRMVRNAWEAFLESQVVLNPKVNGTMFRPELVSGAISYREGRSYINTYVPVETQAIEGDPQPFITLVEKMLPVERDRKIILTYLASMIRNPGAKFQWWPVLQGTEGNGKSAFIRVAMHCVGARYSHLPNVGDMAKNGIKFNSWIVGRLFLGFEEIYVPNRRDFLEELKPTITNEVVQVERKGIDQTMEDNRANGIMCTNHKDGVPTTVDQRRYAVFYTAQQSKQDKIRDGMGGDYFPDLYDWFNGRGKYKAGGPNYGFAIVNWYLKNAYVISPEFDPAGSCQEAPGTSSSVEAIKASYGIVEQEIVEAIEESETGFRGGWVSSKAIDRLLERTKRNVPRNARRRMMQQLGYDWHPALKDGRTSHGTLVDGGSRVVLFVKVDSELTKMTDHRAIIDRYVADQSK